MSLDALRRDLASLHLELPRNGLVTWTSGNISALLARQHGGGLVSPDVVQVDASSTGFARGLMIRDPDGHAVRVVER